MKQLANEPLVGDELGYRLIGFRSLHVKKYRIIYKVEGDIVVVHYIGHRGDVYDKAAETVAK